MVQLLKIKERICQFTGKYEVYAVALCRFLVAFAAFRLINQNIGYMDELEQYPVALLLALLCSFLPSGVMMFFAVVLILAQFYALSLELCGIAALLFLILYCLYLRFSSRKGLYVVLTSVLSVFGVPYTMPVAAGLLSPPYTAVSVVCGEVVYFFLRDVKRSAALFTGDDTSSLSVVTQAVTGLLQDKEMYLYLAAFAAATVMVYCVRRLSADHARTVAAALGVVLQLVVICAGEIALGNTSALAPVIVGCIVSLLIALVIDFMSLSVDCTREEHVQFEDDEYYYYVKAVPKTYVPAAELEVKKINTRKSKPRKLSKGRKVKKVHMPEQEKEETLEDQVMKAIRDEDEKEKTE